MLVITNFVCESASSVVNLGDVQAASKSYFPGRTQDRAGLWSAYCAANSMRSQEKHCGSARQNAGKRKNPGPFEPGSSCLELGSVLLSHGYCHTIIGAEMFHYCVRDGNRWFQLAIAAKQTVIQLLTSSNWQ